MFQNLNLKHFYLFFFINKVVNYQIYHIQKYRVVLMGKLSTIQPPLYAFAKLHQIRSVHADTNLLK